MIYNPYNTTIQNSGVSQPGMVQQVMPACPSGQVMQTPYPVANQMPATAAYPVANQMPATAAYPVANQMPTTAYPVANQMPATAAYPVANQMPTTACPVANQMMYQPVAMPVAHYPVPSCKTPVPMCGVPMQPVMMPQPVQQVQVAQPAQPQLTSTQSTTTQHKKSTYVEAYLEPVDAQVPLMQPTVQKKVVDKKQYPVSDTIVYKEQEPVKNSTMQDYNLYLMEKEYYTEPQKTYTKTTQTATQNSRADHSTLTCENWPLATTYIRPQSYNNLNNVDNTLQQGTIFNDLYDEYVPQKTSKPTVFMLKGGQR